jgi:hypothetical protein
LSPRFLPLLLFTILIESVFRTPFFCVHACYSNFPSGKQGQNAFFIDFSLIFIDFFEFLACQEGDMSVDA